jgi:AAA domain
VNREGIDIIVIDTLNEAWMVENENDARQCLDAIKRLKQIVKKPESNVAILLVTHLRKSAGNGDVGGTRGSSAVPGAVDICISMRQASKEEVQYVDAEKRRNIRVIERTKSRWSNPKKAGSTPEKMWILFDQLEREIDSAYSDASALIDASIVEDCEEIIRANEIDLTATVRQILQECAGYLMLTVVVVRVRDVHKGRHGTGSAKVRIVLDEMVEKGECVKVGGKTNPAYCLSEIATKGS